MKVVKFEASIVLEDFEDIADFQEWISNLFPNYFGFGEDVIKGGFFMVVRKQSRDPFAAVRAAVRALDKRIN